MAGWITSIVYNGTYRKYGLSDRFKITFDIYKHPWGKGTQTYRLSQCSIKLNNYPKKDFSKIIFTNW